MKDRMANEELKSWVKKCMEFRVEGRRPVGIPRMTWLENVEVDMAELYDYDYCVNACILY